MTEEIEEIVRARLGDAVFAVDDETVDDLLGASLEDKSWSLDCVEIATLGLVSSRLARLSNFVGSTIIPSATTSSIDVEADVAQRLDAHASKADVTLIVGQMSEQAADKGTAARQIGIAIRTPERELVTTIHALGNDERARTFAVAGGLHLLRKAL